MEKFAFLKSTRFWKLVIVGVLEALVSVGVITGDIAEVFTRMIELILTGSVVIRTVDRLGEKAGSSDTK